MVQHIDLDFRSMRYIKIDIIINSLQSNDDELTDHPTAGQTTPDHRHWTPIHMEAAGKQTSGRYLTPGKVPNPSLLALTPPQGDDHMTSRDVDVRGPGGLTKR